MDTANLWAKKFTSVGCERKKKSVSAGGVAFIASGGDAELPRRLATQAGRQLRARKHARGAERAAAALDRGAMIPIGSL